MELTYSYQAKIRNTIAALWHYYIYIYAPRVINNLLSAAIWVMIQPWIAAEDVVLLWLAGVLFIIVLVEFPIFCHRYIKLGRSCGAYEEITHIKLNEESLYIERGSDNGTTSLRSLSGYFIYRKRLFLLVGGKSLMCAVNLNEIPEGMEKAHTIMENSPVKKQKFITFRRWYCTGIMIILAAFIIYVQCSGIAE